MTSLLVKTPISANQVTVLSLIFGVTAGWFLSLGHYEAVVVGALMLLVCYIFDNCDGEIARLKGQSSTFGMHFDTAVDWIVHSLFFVALGVGYTKQDGNDLWLWLGWLAAVGGTINYGLGLVLAILDQRKAAADGVIVSSDDYQEPTDGRPTGAGQWAIFIFRELARADFCFLVLGLVAFDVVWVLLPAGAIGSHVYWLLLCFKGARKLKA